MFQIGNEKIEKKFDIIEILKQQKKLKDKLKLIQINNNLTLPNEQEKTQPAKKVLILDSDPDKPKSPDKN